MTLPSPPSDPSQLADTAPLVRRVIELETPFGRPLDWAELAMVTDIGDSHELNDDRCLIVTSKDLGARATGPLSDFLLCVLADGASGSTFGPRGSSMESGDPRTHAGWRASQLAQAVFVERFLSSPEVDLLDRLKDGLRTADSELVESVEGNLSTTLTALVLTADGTAYAASIGDSVLLVLPPRRGTGADRRFKKLGYEETTSVGSGDTTLSNVDENDLIEQWWPNKEGGRASTRLAPGTFLMLVSDGISDNLPAETVDHLLHRHPLDRATIALPLRTRERRAQTQHSGGGSTHQLGLDNMSAIVVRYHGRRAKLAAEKLPRLAGATLMTLMGTHGGPTPSSGGQFGMICLAGQENGATALPGFIRNVLTTEYEMDASDLSRLDDGARDLADGASDPSKRWRGLTDSADPSKRSRGRGDGALDFSARMNTAFVQAMPTGDQSHLTVLALDEHGREHTFSSG